jgi:hypothetical protein
MAGEFFRKTTNNRVVQQKYSWKPDDFDKKAQGGIGNPKIYDTGEGCTVNEDYKVTYVYEPVIVNNFERRLSYVYCDYVE